MKKWVTKYDWIEVALLLLMALCFTLPRYFDTTSFILVMGTVLLCFLPIYYLLTFRNYSLQQNPSDKFPVLMYLWSFVFKCLVLATFALSFSEAHWVGDIADRSSMVSILFLVDRLIMIPYFIVCLYKKAYKEVGVAVVYDLYYQFLGPALTFFVFH